MTSSRLFAAALVAAVGLSVAACPHHGPTGGTGPGTGKGTGTGTAVAVTPDAGVPVRHGGDALLDPTGVGCPATGCVYHAGADGYFTCISGGAGTCFHFGAPCTPDPACMYHAASQRYETCTDPVEGTCRAWGATCAPADACMFDPADGMHHHCDTVKDGGCASWGALCDPG